MQVFQKIKDIRSQLEKHRIQSESIGLVPTMGYLHEGHKALVLASTKQTDVTVCSIFVNPTQFNNQEDLTNYPSSLEDDLEMLESLGCTYVFQPSSSEMYPQPSTVSFHFGSFDSRLEGEWRPGHFDGVALVVSKLLHIIHPHQAFFGKKDLQQYQLVKRMVTDLNMSVEIVGIPTVRADSGLAMSSRNSRLSEAEIDIAANLYKALMLAKSKIRSGEDIKTGIDSAMDMLASFPEIELEYLDVVNTESFDSVSTYSPEVENRLAICLAARIGGVRLIDNVGIGEQEDAD